MRPAICKHRMLCCCGCIPPRYVGILGTPVHCQCWVALGILLNWMISKLFPIRVRFVGAVPVRVEPVCMLSVGFSEPPALQWGVDPTCCLFNGLFIQNHAHDHSIPFSIIWSSLTGKWRVFLIQTVRRISGFLKLSSWGHESHWRLLIWIFIRRFLRS